MSGRLPPHVRAFVARVREGRRASGHELTILQEGLAATVAASDPNHEPAARDQIAAIADAIARTGRWRGNEEWRIGTFFETAIVRSARDGRDWFDVSVDCDGQRLSCGWPTLEKAFAFVRLYQDLIVDQFYSIGPPWADNHLYETEP